MFVSATSTEKVGNVAKTLLGIPPSSSSVSRLNQSLTEPYEVWRERALPSQYRVMSLDGVYFTVRHGDQTASTVILTALGVDLDGKREVLALRACAEESKDAWSGLLNDLRTRGVQGIDLLVTDGHEGILASLREQSPATARQRCVLHKQRNVMNAIPKREQADVSASLSAIWKQETKEEALQNLQAFQATSHKRYPEAVRSLMEDVEHLLTFSDFPKVLHRSIRTTNAIERLFEPRSPAHRLHRYLDHGNVLCFPGLGNYAGYSSPEDTSKII